MNFYELICDIYAYDQDMGVNNKAVRKTQIFKNKRF